MALSDHGQYSGVVDIARNGIDEVIRLQTQAKQNDALIRQLVEALESYRRNHNDGQPCDAERAGRARLLDSDLSNLTERGAHAWAGVDAQKLREGGRND